MTERERDGAAPPAHPDDECLLRQLDGELDATEREATALHLAACRACRARSEDMMSLTRRLNGEVLATRVPRHVTDPEASRRYRRPARSRRTAAALAVGLLLAITLFAPSVRAAVVRMSRALWHIVSDDQEPRAGLAAASSAAEPPALRRSRVAYLARGSEVVVAIASRPQRGSIRLRANDSDSLVVEVNADRAPMLRTAPQSVHVVDGGASHADYLVVVPRAAQRVVLRVEGRVVASMTGAALRAAPDTVVTRFGPAG